MRAVEQRWGLVLGQESVWPSDAFLYGADLSLRGKRASFDKRAVDDVFVFLRRLAMAPSPIDTRPYLLSA